MRAVLPGRFQPFHKGHLKVVEWALERVDELIIVVGSAQESHTLQNPMTAGERVLAIRETLKKYLDRIYIIPVPDILMNASWVAHVKTYVPPFEAVVTRNPLVKVLFQEAGYEVLEPPAFERDKYVATNIRAMMLSGDPSWKELVPEPVAKIIEELGIIRRMRELSKRD